LFLFTSASTSNFTEDKILFDVTSVLCYIVTVCRLENQLLCQLYQTYLLVGNVSNHTQLVGLNFNVFHVWG
jgi:hypothetical protein